ncbi:hypothetical protein FHK02_5232 [Spirosoma sp. LMG 31448]|uniref:Uncharacterized protein n=1 Tax=Spirosoma utsteinense TaxID=2585773 RepID=A0ABR6WFC8_9BACT|nr:hypothetical protein [Spirosoma utsteinense]MBC3794637.1 hypothetical protein [Spirosoma utsteinense]
MRATGKRDGRPLRTLVYQSRIHSIGAMDAAIRTAMDNYLLNRAATPRSGSLLLHHVDKYIPFLI